MKKLIISDLLGSLELWQPSGESHWRKWPWSPCQIGEATMGRLQFSDEKRLSFLGWEGNSDGCLVNLKAIWVAFSHRRRQSVVASPVWEGGSLVAFLPINILFWCNNEAQKSIGDLLGIPATLRHHLDKKATGYRWPPLKKATIWAAFTPEKASLHLRRRPMVVSRVWEVEADHHWRRRPSGLPSQPRRPSHIGDGDQWLFLGCEKAIH